MGDDTSVDKTGFTGDLADRRSAAQNFETGFLGWICAAIIDFSENFQNSFRSGQNGRRSF